MFKFLKGKKTYITAALTAALAGADSLGVHVPVEIYAVLVALGLVSARNGAKTELRKVGF
jgi:hypothetical protein